ncbi:hypothetical protein J6Z19_07590 [bacterium]|nr:hypothetical protein [bacterium]
MKKLFLTVIVLLNVSLFAASAWPCSGDSECPEGTTCDSASSSCVIVKDRITDYAAITLSAGENNPNSSGSGMIFVPNPSNDLVLGQLGVKAYAGDGEGKLYFIQEISADISVYPSFIKFEDFRLVYDANGNAAVDSSDKVVADGTVEGATVKFAVYQKDMSFKMNQTENFLMVASFSSDTPLNDSNSRFNAVIKGKDSIVANAAKKVDVADIKSISFPYFSFEPENGFFLFASGRHFPRTAPSWKEMNKEQNIMHLRLKALDGANELTSLTVNLYGNSVAFGSGIEKISLCTDRNNTGSCDEVVAELSDFIEGQTSAVFQIPSGKIALNDGEEKFLVIKADLNFYNGQNTHFYITDAGITLKTKKKIAGTQIKTENFNYNCSEEDPECRLKPEDGQSEDEGGDSGCSLLFVD